MNKSALFKIIIWSFVALLLVGILSFALTSHETWFSGSLFRLGDYNEEGYSVGNFTLSDKIDTLEIDWISGEINIHVYDGDTIYAEETASREISEKNRMRYRVNGGTLSIHARKPWRWNFFNFGMNLNKKLTIYIPKTIAENMAFLKIDSVSAAMDLSDITVKNLRIDNVSGNIEINRFISDVIDIDMVSGDAKLNDVTAASLKIDSTSGKCTFNGAVSEVDMDSTSGTVHVVSSIVINKINVDTVSGNATFSIPQISGFTANMDSVSGDFNCSEPLVSKGDSHIYGDGSAQYKFDGVSGDVTINIQK